jgi:hypothetical protein
MTLTEVDRFEEVGWGLTGLIWLWKCVENPKNRTVSATQRLGLDENCEREMRARRLRENSSLFRSGGKTLRAKVL